MPTNYLVLTDVDAIQQYVFSSIRMATIVGASAIVANFDTELAKRARRDFNALRTVLSGGNGLFVFKDATRAESFARYAKQSFRAASVSGTLTASQVEPFSTDNETEYPVALRRALDSLQALKRQGADSGEPISLGLAWQCEYCGAEPALTTEITFSDERRRIGRACQGKLQARNKVRSEERDFNELAGDDYLAIMVIDGDGLGKRLQALGSPQAYKAFSKRVKRCIKNAMKAGRGVCERKPAPGKENLDPHPLPIEVLYQGGDDIVIACQSQWALPYAEAFSASLATEDWSGKDWGGGDKSDRVGFSIGISVTRSGFPFRVSHQIANQLLRNAKRAAKDHQWAEGAIDFAIVSEASGDAEVILAEREILAGDAKVSFTGRPYRLHSVEAGGLSKLREACSALKEFPTNRLYALRNQLTASQWRREDGEVELSLQLVEGKVRNLFDNWKKRVVRVKDLTTAWEKACSCLPGSQAESHIYPHGDLADALYLWEKCLGNQV